jgi:hypothetical protein
MSLGTDWNKSHPVSGGGGTGGGSGGGGAVTKQPDKSQTEHVVYQPDQYGNQKVVSGSTSTIAQKQQQMAKPVVPTTAEQFAQSLFAKQGKVYATDVAGNYVVVPQGAIVSAASLASIQRQQAVSQSLNANRLSNESSQATGVGVFTGDVSNVGGKSLAEVQALQGMRERLLNPYDVTKAKLIEQSKLFQQQPKENATISEAKPFYGKQISSYSELAQQQEVKNPEEFFQKLSNVGLARFREADTHLGKIQEGALFVKIGRAHV